MSEAGCVGPMCTYTGERLHSDAEPGLCTQTAGYIANAEIAMIRYLGKEAIAYHDGDSNSDILVWNGRLKLSSTLWEISRLTRAREPQILSGLLI
jgi:hypothetical protein